MSDVKTLPQSKSAIYSLVADVVLVSAFAIIGRSSHGETMSAAGALTTAWPFLTGLALGWLASRNWRSPLKMWPNAIAILVITVMAGMILRVLTGLTDEISFVVVATLVLGFFLLGQRALANLVLRRTKQI